MLNHKALVKGQLTSLNSKTSSCNKLTETLESYIMIRMLTFISSRVSFELDQV